MREYRRLVFVKAVGEADRERILATLGMWELSSGGWRFRSTHRHCVIDNIDELRKQLFYTKAVSMKVRGFL
jgi:hypothetical protein